ncbi:MAG: hypothetical protein AAGN35_19925 [Bacteroidota bacterium]
MKKLRFLPAFLLLFATAFGQQINYKIIHDEPAQPRVNINLEYFNIDMGINNIDGASFNVGSFGFVEPVTGIGGQYNFKIGLLTFGKLGAEAIPGNLELSVGGYLMLQNKIVKKPTRVILNREYKGTEYSRNYKGELIKTTTEEYTFLSVPARRRTMRGVRAGFYLKRGPFASDEFPEDVTFNASDPLGLTSMGLYAGVTARTIKSVFIDTPTHGVQFNSIGDDLVLDLLVIPVNVFRDVTAEARPNISQEVRDALGGNPFGFRIGWYRYQVDKKDRTGKKFGLAAGFEAGVKPYQGIFFNGSLGLTIIKK